MTETNRQIALDYILDQIKKERSFNMANLVDSRLYSDKYKDLNDEAIADAWFNLFLDGWITPGIDQSSGNWLYKGWFTVTPYGKSQIESIGPDYFPVFLDPVSTITELKKTISNIDPIALRYFEESLWAIKKRLFLSAIVTMGCASERSILLLVEAVLDYYDDASLRSSFDKSDKIKPKFELLKKTIKDRSLKKDLLSMFSSDVEKCRDVKYLFIDFDNILDQMFQIYRTNRNDAGHPSGIIFDMDITRAEAAMFRKYCKIIYGLVSYIETAISMRPP